MPRQFIIFGESLVQVQGPQGGWPPGSSAPLNSAPYQLGLAADAITVTMHQLSEACIVDAYGKGNPVDEQVFGGWAEIEMNLVHFNPTVLAACIQMSYPGNTFGEGSLGRAGTRRGGANSMTTGGGYYYLMLNIASPVAGLPYNFSTAFLAENPFRWPVGTTRSIVNLKWKAIAYSIDPYNGGTGSQNIVVYSRTAMALGQNP